MTNARDAELFACESALGRLSIANATNGSKLLQHVTAHDHAWQHNGDIYNTYNNCHVQSSLESRFDQSDKHIQFPQNLVQSYVERCDDGVPITNNIVSYLDPPRSRSSHPRVAVLLGMGGAGKTQIALRCCEKLSENGMVSSLLWVDASSNHSIARSFAEIAITLMNSESRSDLEYRTEHPSLHSVGDNVQVVLQFLETHSPWVLVFDNFDRPMQIRPNGRLRTIRDYWPQKGNGAVLIVSRHHQCSRLGKVFNIGRMSEQECVQVLRNYMGSECSEIYLSKIGHALGYLALAVDQAGAYVQWQSITADQFLQDYWAWKDQILRTIPEDSIWEYNRLDNEDEQIPLSVFTTWEMSLSCLSGTQQEQIQKRHFISTAGFLDPSELHENLFRDLTECDAIFRVQGVWSAYRFASVIAELKSLSLLESSTRTTDGTSFTFHPLVSEWVKWRLHATVASIHVKEACLLLERKIPNVSFDYSDTICLSEFRYLSVHALACARNCSDFLKDCCLATTGPLQRAGEIFMTLIYIYGTADGALSIIEKALAWRSEQEEPWSYRYINLALRRMQLLEDCEGTASMLAGILLDEGEPLELSPVQFAALGCELGTVWCTLHRFEDALSILLGFFEDAVRALGQNHPLIAPYLQQLAIACRGLGHLSAAQTFARDAYSQFLSLLGPDSPATMLVERQLCWIYEAQGKYEEVAASYETNVDKIEGQFGFSHPDTLEWYLDLARVYSLLGRLDDSFKIVAMVLEAAPPSLPATMANAYYTLGQLSFAAKDVRKADSNFQAATTFYEQAGAPLIEEALVCCVWRSKCVLELGSRATGEAMWRRVLDVYNRSERIDYSIESRIFFGILSMILEDIHSPNFTKSAETRSCLDRAIAASRQSQISYRSKLNHLTIAVRAYGEFGEPGLVDKYSAHLLSLCSKHLAYEEVCSTPTDVDVTELACSVPLPSPISTLCDFLIDIQINLPDRAIPREPILPFASFLLAQGDLTNAQIALEQLLSRDAYENGWPQPFFTCNMCKAHTGVVAPIWQCSVCPAVSLDCSCYESYKKMTERLSDAGTSQSGCFKHAFLRVPRQGWTAMSEDNVEHGTSLTNWLRSVKSDYVHSGSHLRPEFEKFEIIWARPWFDDDMPWKFL